MEGDRDMSLLISIKNKKTLEQLKSFNGKWVRLSGKKKWEKETVIELPRYSLKLSIEELRAFQISDLQMFRMHEPSNIAEIDYRIIDRDGSRPHGQSGIPISDKAANNIVASAGLAICIAAGPLSLIPAGIFGLTTLLIDN
jgi:hypothetical protein